jgi:hypothetical protein
VDLGGTAKLGELGRNADGHARGDEHAVVGEVFEEPGQTAVVEPLRDVDEQERAATGCSDVQAPGGLGSDGLVGPRGVGRPRITRAPEGLECGDLREAERLIAVALSGDPPDEIAEELRDLLDMVYFNKPMRDRRRPLSRSNTSQASGE